MRRWVLNCGLFAIRVHHWTASDDDRWLHDHPWWFWTLVLRGGYVDVAAGPTYDPRFDNSDANHTRPGRALPGFIVTEGMRPGMLRKRRAHHAHTVRVDPGGCWTLLLTGPEKRRFGYYARGKWMNAKRYFIKFGLHPCE